MYRYQRRQQRSERQHRCFCSRLRFHDGARYSKYRCGSAKITSRTAS
jgi:hypothetical protein